MSPEGKTCPHSRDKWGGYFSREKLSNVEFGWALGLVGNKGDKSGLSARKLLYLVKYSFTLYFKRSLKLVGGGTPL